MMMHENQPASNREENVATQDLTPGGRPFDLVETSQLNAASKNSGLTPIDLRVQ